MTSLPQYLQQNPRNGCPVEEQTRAQITSPPLYGKKKISYQIEFRDITPDNTINKHCYTSRTCKPNYETNNLSSTCSLNTAFHRHAPRYEQRLRTGQYQLTRIALPIKYNEIPKRMQRNLPVSSSLEQQEESGTPVINFEENCRTHVRTTMFVSTDLPAQAKAAALVTRSPRPQGQCLDKGIVYRDFKNGFTMLLSPIYIITYKMNMGGKIKGISMKNISQSYVKKFISILLNNSNSNGSSHKMQIYIQLHCMPIIL